MPITGNWLGSGQPSPTEYASAVLRGAASYNDVPPAIQSLLRKPIYDMAVCIIKKNDKQERISDLQDVPDGLRSVIEMEVKRLWPIRNKLLR